MNKRILLADDSPTIQKVVELTFMDEAFDVDSVSDGDEALASLRAPAPDILIADVHMPGPSGYEVCREAKRRYPSLPVLLFVGTFEPFDEDEAKACGAEAWLKKPFDSQELLRLVEETTLRGRAAASVAPPSAPTAGFDLGAAEAEDAAEGEDIALDLEEIDLGDSIDLGAPADPSGALSTPGDELELPELEVSSIDDGIEQTVSDDTESAAEDEVELMALGSEASEAAPPVDTREVPITDWEPTSHEPPPLEMPLPEMPAPDLPVPDLPVPDLPVPEPMGSGFEAPESAVPESAVPESAVPETPAPESLIPEPPIPGPPIAGSPVFESPVAESSVADPSIADVPVPESAAPSLSDEDVERVARRVVELLGADTVREVAWDVIPDMAEIVIKDRIRQLEAEAE